MPLCAADATLGLGHGKGGLGAGDVGFSLSQLFLGPNLALLRLGQGLVAGRFPLLGQHGFLPMLGQ